jgi:hypothetical protein
VADYTPTIPEYDRLAQFCTYQDCVDRLLIYFDRPNRSRDKYLARQAVENALSTYQNAALWKWLTEIWTLRTTAAYDTGTITYDHTGGTAERLVTLADGTWPADAAYGTVVIDDVLYQVASRLGDTTITLRADCNPGADVAAGASYMWWRHSYALPCDWWKLCDPVDTELGTGGPDMEYRPADEIEGYIRSMSVTPVSRPTSYTIARDPRRGCLCLMMAPPPNEVRTYQFVYHRLPRPLRVYKYASGTVTVAAGATAVTGSGTAWTSDHVGSVLRIGSSGSLEPTSQFGNLVTDDQKDIESNPAAYTRIITAVGSATSCTVDAAIPSAVSAARYVISDPLDIDWTVASKAFQRRAEYEFSVLAQDFENQAKRLAIAENEMEIAKWSDVRDVAPDAIARPWWLGSSLWAGTSNVNTDYDAA